VGEVILYSKNPARFAAQLDIAHDYARAGFLGEAIELLAERLRPRVICRTKAGARCRCLVYLGWLQEKLGDKPAS